MDISQTVKDRLIKALSSIGTNGATIIEISSELPYERHTVSKYLSFMEAEGLVYHKKIGKAKLWFINVAPLQTVLNILPERRTFVEKILSDILTNVPYGLMVIDYNYVIQFMNNKAFEDYGQQEGQSFYKSVLGMDNPLKLKSVRTVVEAKAESAEVKVKDKREKWLKIKACTLVNSDKSVSTILILEDITDAKKAQELISEQKMLLEAERDALNKSSIVVETDLDGKLTYVNEKFIEMSGYSKKELIGQTHRIVNSGYHPKVFFNKLWKTISSGKVWRGEIKNKAKDGSLYWTDCTIAPVMKNGKPVKYVAIRYNLSKFKKN